MYVVYVFYQYKIKNYQKRMEDLVLSCLESRVEEARNLYARFLVGPFLKGDALTVATALRRVLLSSIESIGITALYIQGITHEFSTIVGVRESVLELSLNFQAIVLSYDKTFFQKKNFFDDLQIGYLQVQGPKVIYANDLKLPLGVRLVDPTQYIATISKEGSIVLKFIIGKKKAFLHQNTGPESFFGNPARDLPITGKVSKKNLARAKKTCLYKKGSTIDWLRFESLGQNVLQRQKTALTPRLVTCPKGSQRRSFTNAYFFFKFPSRIQSQTNYLVKQSFPPVRARQGSQEESPCKSWRAYTRPTFKGSLSSRRLVNGDSTKVAFMRSLLLYPKGFRFCKAKPSFLFLQSKNPCESKILLRKIRFLQTKKRKLEVLFPQKERPFAVHRHCFLSRFRDACPYKSPICNRFVRARMGSRSFVCAHTNFREPRPPSGVGHVIALLGHAKKNLEKPRFVMLTKQKKFFTNAHSFISFCKKPQSKFYPYIPSLLKTDMALFLKKKRAIKEKDVRKKILFLKSNDNVFKSDICLRNVIPLDFTLTPVLKVNFVVEIDDEVLYLRQKVRERIILEVWTNGSIHPRQAVHDAALSLTDIFASFRSVYGAKS